MYRSCLLCVFSALSIFCLGRQALSADELYLPRFEKLNDEQREMLRECLLAHDKLSELYANFTSSGTCLLRTHPTLEDRTTFTYTVRDGGEYILYRVLKSNQTVQGTPCGVLLRPDGYASVDLPGNRGGSTVMGNGTDIQAGYWKLSSLGFSRGPLVIHRSPTWEWLTDEKFIADGPPNPAVASELTVDSTDTKLGTVVTLVFTYPGTNELRRIEFLRDHLWAIKQSEVTRKSPDDTIARVRASFEYDLSIPDQPKMTRFTDAHWDHQHPTNAATPDLANADRFDDYRFEKLEFVAPDLRAFEPSALGLSQLIPDPTPTAPPPKARNRGLTKLLIWTLVGVFVFLLFVVNQIKKLIMPQPKPKPADKSFKKPIRRRPPGDI